MSKRRSRQKRRRRNELPETFERDWEFYMKNMKKFTFCGCVIEIPKYSNDGLSAKLCFYKFDTEGLLLSCTSPQLFHDVLRCKKSIGFHIILYTEGYTDMCIGISELLKEFIDPPDWVGKSLRQQLVRQYYETFKNTNRKNSHRY